MQSSNYISPTLQAIDLIERRTGIAAGTQFRADLDSVLYNQSQGDIKAYVQRLTTLPETGPEWQALIHAITVGETYFMREPAHFNLLKTHILPELIANRRKNNQRTINIWSVGCATGEEAYSIAVTLHETLPDLNGWTINLIGTDLNNQVLEIARRGMYRKWSFRHTDSTFRQQYFSGTGNNAQLTFSIRQMVNFRQSNILHGPPLPQFDIIFCRNVLLYFSRRAIQRVEDIMFDNLTPGGWLIMGQSEALRYARERWITHIFPGTAIYQKPSLTNTLTGGDINYQIAERVEKPSTLNGMPEPPRPSTYQDAVRAVHEEKYDDAECYLAEVLDREPKNAQAYVLLASIFANRQAIPEAETHLETALRYEPLLADAHYVKAMVELERPDSEAARKALQAALYCQRDHALASFMLGNLHAQEGNLTKAYKVWQNARSAVETLELDDYLSDLSDMTAGQFNTLLDSHLDA